MSSETHHSVLRSLFSASEVLFEQLGACSGQPLRSRYSDTLKTLSACSSTGPSAEDFRVPAAVGPCFRIGPPSSIHRSPPGHYLSVRSAQYRTPDGWTGGRVIHSRLTQRSSLGRRCWPALMAAGGARSPRPGSQLAAGTRPEPRSPTVDTDASGGINRRPTPRGDSAGTGVTS